MKVIAVNGSPRKKWNTATLLEKALEGAASRGAETELVHLYDLSYKGCISCFACKRKGGKSYGHCAVNDDLQPVLRKIEEAGGLILGSPIYYGMVTGEMRSFLERLLFQYLVYDAKYSALFPGRLSVGCLYTMNVDAERLKDRGYEQTLKTMENAIQRTLAVPAVQTLYVTDTVQFDNYANYETSAFNAEHKAKRRQEEFPKDCAQAFDMGARLAG